MKRRLKNTYRDQIAHERVDEYDRKAKLKKEEKETEIDPETPQRKGERVVYVVPTMRDYHTNRRCEYLTEGIHEERNPCNLCLEETEDVLNSRIGSKMLGFVSGKAQYHDDGCQFWISERCKETRTVCFLCQEQEDIEEACRFKGNRATGSNQHS